MHTLIEYVVRKEANKSFRLDNITIINWYFSFLTNIYIKIKFIL